MEGRKGRKEGTVSKNTCKGRNVCMQGTEGEKEMNNTMNLRGKKKLKKRGRGRMECSVFISLTYCRRIRENNTEKEERRAECQKGWEK